MSYPSLFTPLNIGKYQIKNRLVALPVHTGFAHTDGSTSSWMVDFYSRIADSGVGMVVVANAAVSHDGVVSRFNLRIDRDEFIPGLSKLADAIKQKGAIACIQLNHAGRFARTERPLLPSAMTSANLSFNVESLKGFMEFFPFEKRFGLTRYVIDKIKTWRDPMTADDRERVINDFASAAFRAYLAGFDMVELHGANGYLLCQYLSLFTNQIKSGFGGDFHGRMAFPLAVIRKIKRKLPKEIPIGFRLLLREWVPGGIDLPESLAFASVLEDEGIVYLSASVGSYNSILSPAVLKKMSRIAYLESDMEILTARVNIPTIISGRITTPLCADKLIQDGVSDLIGLGRPIRTDLQWVAKARNPDSEHKIIKCINCNWCLKRVVLEQGFNCRLWPKLHKERTILEHKLLTRNSRTLWIIADQNDMQIFKESLVLVIHAEQNGSDDVIQRECELTVLLFQPVVKRSWPDSATPDHEKQICFHGKVFNDNSVVSAVDDFVKWIETRLDSTGANNIVLKFIVRNSDENIEETVHDEIKNGEYGRIFICANRKEPWRERLLYKESGKVVVYLNSNNRNQRVIVPVDLSDTTLLVMTFLKQTYMQKKGFSFNFVHVITGYSEVLNSKALNSEDRVLKTVYSGADNLNANYSDTNRFNKERQRWRELKKIAGFNPNIPLEFIFTDKDVTPSIVHAIQIGQYGTVVMGKRGLSGIKRWLLGSVSAGVLHKLIDQSMFLID
ncbi:MAG: universal stress protein [Desulfamplus sp.]|nr:universal stress protein [Desulfamplus sp.]